MLQASILDDIAPVIGFTATCALVAWWGDKNLYVPGKFTVGHPLARVIGEPALRALVREFGDNTLAIPADVQTSRFRRDRAVCERFAEGWTPARVADEFRISQRRAQQLREELIERGWMAYVGDQLQRTVGPGA